jgi:polyphosphate kinase
MAASPGIEFEPAAWIDLDRPEYYVNRELSLLDFQHRVLEEAQDQRNPLLERAKFLSIVSSNLDEFFMVRAAGLQQQIAAGVHDISADGLASAAQLAVARKAATKLMVQMNECLLRNILPALNQAGIYVLNYADLTEKQRGRAKSYFEEIVFPVLTPLAFDPGRPFPHISSLSLNLAILIRDKEGVEHFSRLKVPGTLPQLVPLKRSSGSARKDGTIPHNHYFVWLDQVIIANLADLFPGMEIVEAHPFHVTRNADMLIQELEADDLLDGNGQTKAEGHSHMAQRSCKSIHDDCPATGRKQGIGANELSAYAAPKAGCEHEPPFPAF